MDHKDVCNHSNCNAAIANESVRQTLSEMDWERSIWNAAFSGEKDRVQSLISKARNPKDFVNNQDNSGYTALHYAARNGHVDVCSILIKNGACINTQTRCGNATALHKAAAADAVCSAKVEINLNLEQNSNMSGGKDHSLIQVFGQGTLLVSINQAAVIGKDATVKYLIEQGAQLDLQDADGKTALHKVVENKQHGLINVLLEACPELGVMKDNKGNLAIE